MVVSLKFVEVGVNVMMALQGLDGGRQKVPFRVLALLGSTARTPRAFAGVEFNRRDRRTRIKRSRNMTS